MENAVSAVQLAKNFVLKKRDGLRWTESEVKAVDGITLSMNSSALESLRRLRC